MLYNLIALTKAITSGCNLSADEASNSALAMADEKVSDEFKLEFLLALSRKGETATEVAAFARVYRNLARHIDLGDWPKRGIDVVGTGGDQSGSFNISSVSALIVAAAGVPVLKHGNRSITSKSGSADFFLRLGVEIEASDSQIRRNLEISNFCYLYAPAFHPAFKSVVAVRRQIAELGYKTIFNILGPLINPTNPLHAVIGVYDERWVEPIASALNELGILRGLVTHSRAGKGMDEITTAGEIRVRGCGELEDINTVWIPSDFGFNTCTVSDLRGGSPEENISLLNEILMGGVCEGLVDTLCLSAGTALWVANHVSDPSVGASRAREIILNGELREQIRRLNYSNVNE